MCETKQDFQTDLNVGVQELSSIPFLRNVFGAMGLIAAGVLSDSYSRHVLLSSHLFLDVSLCFSHFLLLLLKTDAVHHVLCVDRVLHHGLRAVEVILCADGLSCARGIWLRLHRPDCCVIQQCTCPCRENSQGNFVDDSLNEKFRQDLFRRDRRGLAFASQAAAAVVGAIVGALITGLYATETIFSFSGWRVIFVAFGLFSLSVSACGFFFLFDPERGQVELEEPSEDEQQTVIAKERETFRKLELSEVLANLRNPSYLFLTLSMILHAIPGVGFSFLLLFLQCSSLSDDQAAVIYSLGISPSNRFFSSLILSLVLIS